MRIGFHTNNLSFRGAEIAVFDYALHNQSLLHNESLIFYKSKLPSEPSVVSKFEKNFKIFAYQDTNHLARLADQEKLDLLYFIKSGERDGDIVGNVPCAVHAVFPTKVEQFHGDKLAFVSQWLAKEYSNSKVPFVPHMIDLPEVHGNLREELNIPKDATVLASYGGSDSFNLPFVHETILKALSKRKDLYFIFMNFALFVQNEKNWDAYSKEFSPQAIMPKFDSVFIKGPDFEPQSIGPLDQLAIEGYRFGRKLRNLSKKYIYKGS